MFLLNAENMTPTVFLKLATILKTIEALIILYFRFIKTKKNIVALFSNYLYSWVNKPKNCQTVLTLSFIV